MNSIRLKWLVLMRQTLVWGAAATTPSVVTGAAPSWACERSSLELGVRCRRPWDAPVIDARMLTSSAAQRQRGGRERCRDMPSDPRTMRTRLLHPSCVQVSGLMVLPAVLYTDAQSSNNTLELSAVRVKEEAVCCIRVPPSERCPAR
jgi:hypothetical protein